MNKYTALPLKLIGEIIFALVIVWLLLCVTAVVALKYDAIPRDYIIAYIEQSFQSSIGEDQNLVIKDIDIQWPSFDAPMVISLHEVEAESDGKSFLNLARMEGEIYPFYLLLGHMRFEDITIQDIDLSLQRSEGGRLTIMGREAEDINPNSDRPYLTLSNLIYDLPRFETATVENMTINIQDDRFERMNVIGPIDIATQFTQELGERYLTGRAVIPFDTSENNKSITLNFRTMENPLTLGVIASFDAVLMEDILQFIPPLPDGWDVQGSAQAKASLTIDNLWRVNSLDFDVEDANGRIIIGYEDQPSILVLNNLKGRITKLAGNDAYHFESIAFETNDEIQVLFNGNIDISEGFENMAGDYRLQVDRIVQSALDTYWPDDHKDIGAYNWLVEKMSDGVFQDIDVSMAFNRKWVRRKDGVDLPPWLRSVEARFGYDGMQVDYRSPLKMAENVSGTGVYNGTNIVLDIDSAVVGGMNVSQAKIDLAIIDATEKGTATLDIPIKAALNDVLDYIKDEPISALDRVDLDVAGAKGAADLDLNMVFPLDKDLQVEDIVIDVSGVLSDTQLPNVIRGLTLAGGPFDFKTDGKAISLAGSGRLGGAPVTLDYNEVISGGKSGQTTLEASVGLNQTIRAAYTGDMADHFGGGGNADIRYVSDSAGNADMDLTLDLQDSSIDFHEIGYTKAKGQALDLSSKINLKNGDLERFDSIKAQGHFVMQNGQLNFRNEGGEPVLESGYLNGIAYKKNEIDIKISENKNSLDLDIQGASFDATPILKGSKTVQKDAVNTVQKTSRPFRIDLQVLELFVSEGQALTNVIASAKSNQNAEISQFNLDGGAGRGNLMVRYNPQVTNGLSLQVESDNAGDTLRIFDLYSDIEGGRLRIAGKPVEGGHFGDVRGRVRIDDFEVNDTPVLMRLLNAISLQGLDDDLRFRRLETGFEWRRSPQGDMYVIEDGRTSGASVGFTFDGYVDTAQDAIDIQGTAAPLSPINNLVGNIPIIGDILTGGGGALLAATYTIGGSVEEPTVAVNPLSVLAPGILRKMLFEGVPQEALPSPQQ